MDPVEKLVYEGLIGGEIILSAMDNLTYTQWAVLQELNYTVFTAKMNPPIEPGSARWVRWRFKGETAASNLTINNKFLLKMTNQIHYDYQIRGMFDVKNQFMELLYVLRENIKGQNVVYHELQDDINDLLNFFIESKLTYPKRTEKELPLSNVRNPDWRVHIWPGKLNRITDIIMKGDAEIIGGVPNFMTYENQIIPVYEWKAGSTVSHKGDDKYEYSFSIFFQTKEFSWLGSNILWGLIVIILLLTIIRLII